MGDGRRAFHPRADVSSPQDCASNECQEYGRSVPRIPAHQLRSPQKCKSTKAQKDAQPPSLRRQTPPLECADHGPKHESNRHQLHHGPCNTMRFCHSCGTTIGGTAVQGIVATTRAVTPYWAPKSLAVAAIGSVRARFGQQGAALVWKALSAPEELLLAGIARYALSRDDAERARRARQLLDRSVRAVVAFVAYDRIRSPSSTTEPGKALQGLAQDTSLPITGAAQAELAGHGFA
mmetsp:Transcript_5241/g.14499  ORF Transcript_5241/g.14499 Transcript_5241/m.14499 type:complete len:235 (-) Transcript_5241:293-997(-)